MGAGGEVYGFRKEPQSVFAPEVREERPARATRGEQASDDRIGAAERQMSEGGFQGSCSPPLVLHLRTAALGHCITYQGRATS